MNVCFKIQLAEFVHFKSDFAKIKYFTDPNGCTMMYL